MEADQTKRVCSKCGTALPPDAPQGLCPACLLERGCLENQADCPQPDSELAIETTGTMIGRYKLLEHIGEGAFGVVFMAEQIEPVHRKVALKIIKAGMDTKEVIARFEAERQALALMDHSNIAQVFDGGVTPVGRPYFVMELVRGIPITKFCDQRNLDTKARLRLFMQVCKAAQHAHQKGIIHRDLKPSNILVTHQESEPMPKIIDFGVAKALGQKLTDKTLFTGFLRMVGTPAYMSPEQAEFTGMDVDTRSDVYSLGVLLYELLTGVTPFDPETLRNAALDEVRRMIRETDPPRPSTRLPTLGDRLEEIARQRHTEAVKLTHALRGDLDWIVMKCLEKDRRRRYETVNGLAMDVQRHLDDEPVVARPPSKLYEFQKSVRRHKIGFAAAGAITMALAVGLTISLVSLHREKTSRERAVAAEQEQVRLREEAETEAARSAEVAQFLKDMLKAAGPSVARGRDSELLREILDQTTERVTKDLPGQPEVQGDLWFTIGKTYADIGDYARAIIELQRAVATYRKALGEKDAKVALALGTLGIYQATAGNLTLAQSNATTALRLARASGDQRTLAACLCSKAYCLDPGTGGMEQVPYFREAATIYESLGDDPHSLTTCLRYLGNALMEGSQDFNEAKRLFTEALRLDRLTDGENSLSVADDRYFLAQIFKDFGELDKAEEYATEAFKRYRDYLGNDQTNLYNILRLLAHVLILGHKPDEAEAVCRQVVETSPSNGGFRAILAATCARTGNWSAAADELDQVVKLDAARVFENSPLASPTELDSFQLAVALLKAGRTNEYLQHCHNFLKRLGNTRDVETADALAGASLLLPVKGDDFDRACQMADFAASVTESKRFARWSSLVKALAELRRGRYESSIVWVNRTLTLSGGPAYRQYSAAACFIQAAAFSRLQHMESAKAALTAGERRIVAENFNPYTGHWDGNWHDWAIADTLQQQARELIDRETISASQDQR